MKKYIDVDYCEGREYFLTEETGNLEVEISGEHMAFFDKAFEDYDKAQSMLRRLYDKAFEEKYGEK